MSLHRSVFDEDQHHQHEEGAMEKTKLNESQEITSFNQSVPELPSLIELDDSLLELVTGGGCGTYTLVCGAHAEKST
jgi:hypothetical protein